MGAVYKLGIIGGMGPLATNELYKRIILATPANSDNVHIDMLILSHASIPDRTDSIINNRKKEFLDIIKKDFDILNDLAVEKIAIPCNTSHFFYDDFLAMTDIPIVNMVEEIVKKVKDRGFDKACVFATRGTYASKIYEKYAKKHDVEIILISEKEKDFVMSLIYEVKSEGVKESLDFEYILKEYLQEDVLGILACTELSLLPIKTVAKERLIDALDVLVEKCLFA